MEVSYVVLYVAHAYPDGSLKIVVDIMEDVCKFTQVLNCVSKDENSLRWLHV